MWQIAHEPMLEARRKPPRYSIVQNRTGRCGSLEREILLANGEAGENPTECIKWTVRMPFTIYYWQLAYIISAYMPEIRVNPEGVYMVSVHFVVMAMCLVVFLILLGPFLVPFAILCAMWHSDRKCHDRLLLLLMFGLALLPPYLLSTMTMVAFQKETLQEFRKAENSMLELCGPYVCLLISSLVFLADVCQCSIEKGIAKMVLDEMDELNVIRKSGDRAADSDSNLAGQLLEIICYIDTQIHENVQFWPSRSLTSKFMKVMQQILVAVNKQDKQEMMELELDKILKQESMSPQQASPLQLLVLMVCSLGPAFFPTIWRFLTDCEDVFFSMNDGVKHCQRAYLLMAFVSSAHLISSCCDLNENLDRMELSQLATLFLAAPFKRRQLLTTTYQSCFKRLILRPFQMEEANLVETVDLIEAEKFDDDNLLRETLTEGFCHLRYDLSTLQSFLQVLQIDNKSNPAETTPKGEAIKSKQPDFGEDDPCVSWVTGDGNDHVEGFNCLQTTFLDTRKFALLQLFARADCLVLEVKSQVVLFALTIIMVMCAVILAFSVGLIHGQHAITPWFCVLFLPCILIAMLMIMNKLVKLDVHLYEDTLKILQSWRERMKRWRYAITIEEAIGDKRMQLDSFFTSLIDPVAGLIDYTKNWQKRVQLLGHNASSSRRNRMLLSFVMYLVIVLWHFLTQKAWFIELQEEWREIAFSQGISF